MKFLSVVVGLAALVAVHGAPLSHDEIVANSSNGLRLLSLEEGAEPVWKTEDEKLELLRAGVKFFDVTEVYELQKDWPAAKEVEALVTYPAPSHQTAVKAVIARLSTARMQADLATLTAFNNRYYTSSTGVSSSAWILSTVRAIAANYTGVTAAAYTHSWAQSSVIAKIPGSVASTPVTILGSHQDSINLNSPSSGRAPGADDDGTGTVNLIETFRTLLSSGFKPSYPVEFHWYAAEEVGLLGSNAIATAYKNSGVKVKAFLQLDMTGYFAPGSEEVIALEADYIDSGLNTFLGQLVDNYANIPWTMDIPCGYACSDHASWYRAGYPSSFPFEAVTGDDNPRIHSTSDTTSVSGFSWSHSLEFTKVAVAFAYELAI